MKLLGVAVFLLINMVSLNNTLYALDSTKEQVAKQNILTLFSWIEQGSPEKAEAEKVVAVIKAQLKVLRKECVLAKAPCPQVYVYLDKSFFNTLIRDYKIEDDNRSLFNRLFAEAAARIGPNNGIPEPKPKHPWLDIKNSLIDCLENEVVISCSGSTKSARIDLTKPEIYIAPDVPTIAALVEGALSSILKTNLTLSGNYRLVHKGSTSRGTSLNNADFDYDLLFVNQKDLENFLKKRVSIIHLLTREWELEGYDVLSRLERKVAQRSLFNFRLKDKNGVVLQIQLFVGRNKIIYADDLNVQIEQIKALGGNWNYVRGQIILFKKLVKDVLHSYKTFYGGLDGVRCEQLIIQAGSSTNSGRKITSIGSFDKTMHWIYSIGFDRASSTIIPFERISNRLVMFKYSGNNPLFISSPVIWNKFVR